MRRFAIVSAVVSNVVSFVRASGIVVAANMQGILHHLTDTLGLLWLKQSVEGDSIVALQMLNGCRGIFGLPQLVPVYATAPCVRGYLSSRRQTS